MRTKYMPLDELMKRNKNKKKHVKPIKKRIDGFATQDGCFFKVPLTGTFANSPKFYKAYLIVYLSEEIP